MTKKITKNFEVHNAKQFVESIDEQSNSLYYVFGGRHIQWPSDSTPPPITDSLEDTYYQLYRDMMFGKKVKATDMAIIPDLNNSALTLGPTFSTLLKLKLFPKDLSRLAFISSMTFFLLSLFSNLTK